MPRPDGSVRLPMDLPPSKRESHAGPLMQGIHTSGSAGQVYVPLYAVPWNPTDYYPWASAQGSVAAASLGQPASVRPQQPGSAAYGDPQSGAGSPFPIGKNPSANGQYPKWVTAINAYSPVAHRKPTAMRDGLPPRVISARGVGKPTQRPRGYAPGYTTAWPVQAPSWPTWREAPQGSRPG